MSRWPAVFAFHILVLALLIFGQHGDGAAAEASCRSGDGTVCFAEGTYVVSPSQSVSMSETSVWRDNRVRAYASTDPPHIDGFVLFDIGSIPDTETIVSLTLRCYLEDEYGSPNQDPVVDVYYCAVDGWDRGTVTTGSLSLDTLLVDDVPFSSYVSYCDFNLDMGVHDWSTDLLDDQICIGLRNDMDHPLPTSFVYFFGAYGDPVGAAPELIVETTSPVEHSSWSRVKGLYRQDVARGAGFRRPAVQPDRRLQLSARATPWRG